MRDINIDTQLLRSLVAVADVGSFARAAEMLHMTQPAMSQQMRRLEELLGHPLFRRSGRKLLFSPQGEVVLGYARRILDLNDEIPRRLAGSNRREIIHLGMPEHFSESLLPLVISAVYVRYPDVQLVVKVGRSQTLNDSLNEGRLHLAIILDEYSRTAGKPPLHVAPLTWFGSSEAGSPAERGAEVPLVLFRAPCGLRSLAIEALERACKPWRCVHESEELSVLRAAVRVNIGVTALPAFQSYPDIHPIDDPTELPALPSIAVSLRRRSDWAARAAPDLETLVVDVWDAFRSGTLSAPTPPYSTAPTTHEPKRYPERIVRH